MEKMKRGIVVMLIGVASLVGVSTSSAQQVNVNSDFPLLFADGTLADFDTEIIVGKTTDFAALAELLLMDPASLESSMLFSEYGRGNVGDAGLGIPGLFFFGLANTDTSFFDVDMQIILIARNLNRNVPEVGLFTDPSWIFPDDGIGTSVASINTMDVKTDGIRIGRSGGPVGIPDVAEFPQSLHMQAIPEPSTYLLVGLGMLTLAGIKRRK